MSMPLTVWLENPRRLARVAFYGAAFTSLSFAFEFATQFTPALSKLASRFGPWLTHSSAALLGLGPIVLGGAACWLALSRFHRGLVNEQWTETQLDEVRSFLKSPETKWVVIPLLIVYLAASVAYLTSGHPRHAPSPSAFLLFFLAPNYVIGHLRAKVVPLSTLEEPQDWTKRPRLFSAHWGEPSSR
jgi:hypothetical protein